MKPKQCYGTYDLDHPPEMVCMVCEQKEGCETTALLADINKQKKGVWLY